MSKTFVDTSFFKAIVDRNDDFNSIANKIWSKLMKNPAPLVTSNYILDESYTLVRQRCDLKTAQLLNRLVATAAEFEIDRVLTEDEQQAWVWFQNDWSKLSFTDCVSFAQMNRLGLTQVLTFDHHFDRAGFKIVK